MSGSAPRGIVAAALLVASAGAVSGQSRTEQKATIVPGTFTVQGESVAVDQGSFGVPADWRAPAGDSMTLRFVRFASTAAVPGPPIVFLAGGPGDAATRAFGGIPRVFLEELRAIGDVIAFDQRGTGTSEPLHPVCPPAAAYPADVAANPDRMLDSLRARVARCIADAPRRGIVLAGLTTAQSADDLAALARAMGESRLSLLAGSYGTHLALAAARRHPRLIHRMVLAGVEGPDHTLKHPARVDEVLAAIAADRRPELLEELRTLRRRLATEHATAHLPGRGDVVVGEWDLQRWVADALDAVREIDALVAAVPVLLAGDFSPLARWAVGFRAPRPLNLMNLAMDCASGASPERLAAMRGAAADAVLGDAINFPLPQLCDLPGLPRLDDDFRAPLHSDVPALLVSGTFDGRTPVHNAHEVARTMPNSRVLVIEGASHGLFGEARVLLELTAFLRN